MKFSDKFFEPEVRDGFYVSSMMKRSWAAQLEILEVLDKFCEEHDVAYFAHAGTLLGAVRHGGFIPWDDDMDLCMLRKDYEKFISAAEQGLPDGYNLLNFRREDTEYMVLRIMNSRAIRFDDAHLEKFHGFPYSTGIDIFVLDNIMPDEKEQQAWRAQIEQVETLKQQISMGRKNRRKLQNQLRELAKVYHVDLNTKLSLMNQIYVLMDHLFSICGDHNTERIANIAPWFNNGGRFYFFRKYFAGTIWLPFETTRIPVPAAYNRLIGRSYGSGARGAMKSVRGYSQHDYPLYACQEQTVIEKYGWNPMEYKMPVKELQSEHSALRGKPKEKAKEFIGTLAAAHEKIRDLLEMGLDLAAEKILEVCQNGAIQMGTMIEEAEGEDSVVVQILEEYCDQVFMYYQMLSDGKKADGKEIYENLNYMLKRIMESVETCMHTHREVLFLPFKAEGWKYLEEIWKEECGNPDCEVHVVPVPYHIKKTNREPGNLYYEGDMLPENIPVEDYRNFDFKEHRPDVVYFQNPYDDCDTAICTPQAFTSKALREYAKKLVYVPYFCVEEFDSNDGCAMAAMKNYCVMPGVFYADQIILQSDNMKQRYIETLTKAAGEDTRPVWEEKILISNPPITYHAPWIPRENIKVPDSWLPILKNADGSWKKVVLYAISASAIYSDREQALQDIKQVLEGYHKEAADTALIFCSYETLEEMNSVLDDEIQRKTKKLIEDYQTAGWGIWAQPSQMDLLVDLCDAYCGEMGTAMFRCMNKGKQIVTFDK